MPTRSEKWALKTSPDLLFPKLEALHEASSAEIKETYDAIDSMYARVAPILDKYGIVGSARLMYRCFMEECYRITRNFTDKTRDIEATAVYFKYLLYGAEETVLNEICRLFDIIPMGGIDYIAERIASELKGIPIEGTIVADGSEQTILESSETETHYFAGYVDLSELAAGEQVIMKEYVSLVLPVDYKSYHDETYTGVLSNPVLFIYTRPARCGLKLTMKQISGTHRNFKFQLFRGVIG
jgi:hypothetical protein